MTLEDVATMAKQSAITYNGHVPMLIVEGTRDRALCSFNDFPATHEERCQALLGAGKTMAREERIGQLVRVFFISEAWMSIAQRDKPLTVALSKDPNRKEVLIIGGEDVSEKAARVAIFEMVRDDKGAVSTLTELAKGNGTVHSPLLDAFIMGFVMEQRKQAA